MSLCIRGKELTKAGRKSRRLCIPAALLSLLWALCGVCASFQPLEEVEFSEGPASQCALATDASGEVRICVASAGRLFHGDGRTGFTQYIPIAPESDGLSYDAPSLVTNLSGTSYVAFRVTGPEATQWVAWTRNPGGHFRAPEAIPESEAPQVSPPCAFLAPDGEILVAWWAGENENGEVLFSRSGGRPMPVAQGHNAVFACDKEGFLHAVFVRGGDLFYTTDRNGDFGSNEKQVTTTPEEEIPLSLGVLEAGSALVLFGRKRGDRMETYLTGGGWLVERQVGRSVAVWPSSALLTSCAGSSCVIVQADGSSVWVLPALLEGPLEGEQAFGLSGTEEFLCARADRFSFLHICVVRSGSLLYTNSAPPPHAAFTAKPTRGEAPLEVAFSDFSTGHVIRRLWEFGDGTVATSRQPVHTFREPGEYSVSLAVYGPAGRVDKRSQENLIRVVPNANRLVVSEAAVYAGQKGVHLPLRVTNDRPISGFQIACAYDSDGLLLEGGDALVNFHRTVCEELEPEFVAVRQAPGERWFAAGVILDIAPPLTGKVISPGRERNLVNLVVSIAEDLPDGTIISIAPTDGVGDPPLVNSFTVQDGTSIRPFLRGGSIAVFRPEGEPLGVPFLRGDANEDGGISIGDCVAILGVLFAGKEGPRCLDSADVDDNGRLNIGDAIYVLTYLFQLAVTPPFPFPTEGLDPTPDSLPPCRS